MNDDDLRREYQRSKKATPPGSHPDPEKLGELVSGALSESARLELLEHVLRCPTCGPELDLLRAASEGARAAEHRMAPSRWMALAAAALILVGIGVLTLRGHNTPLPPDVMRGGHTAMGIIEPVSGSNISAPVTLTWHRLDGAQSYHVELLSERGEVIEAWSTADTTLAIPDSLHLGADKSYDVWVRARLSDRTEVSSPLVRFSVQ